MKSRSNPPLLLISVAAMLTAGLLLSTSGACAQAQSPADPRGRWITANGNLEVEIAPCGAALCGTVTQVLGNRSMGSSNEEMKPADPRPAMGMKLLIDFAPASTADTSKPASEWTGKLYNRENAKTYSCTMSVSTADNASGELLLHPYVGIPLFGKTLRWTRAPGTAPTPSRR
ncbi:MAG: DUF2147 domain-containing protein [Burkholderiales bacterium]